MSFSPQIRHLAYCQKGSYQVDSGDANVPTKRTHQSYGEPSFFTSMYQESATSTGHPASSSGTTPGQRLSKIPPSGGIGDASFY